MTANQKIYEGMKLIKEGCAQKEVGTCIYCPFYSYCMFSEYHFCLPEEWKLKEVKENA
jgi:hypothetical protein